MRHQYEPKVNLVLDVTGCKKHNISNMKGKRTIAIILFMMIVLPMSVLAQEQEKVSNYATVLKQNYVVLDSPVSQSTASSSAPKPVSKKQKAAEAKAAKADIRAEKARAKLARREAEIALENAQKAQREAETARREAEKKGATTEVADPVPTGNAEPETKSNPESVPTSNAEPETKSNPESRLEAARARLEAIRNRKSQE